MYTICVSQAEVGQAIQRKEKELAAIAAKIEDEQSLGSKTSKQVKELGTRLEELEEELEIERSNRGKAEKGRQAMTRYDVQKKWDTLSLRYKGQQL